MILLDTHALIWFATAPKSLSRSASEAIIAATRTGGLAISAITLWELASLATHNRLEVTGTLEDIVEEFSSRTSILPISAKIAVLANQPPAFYPSDPCDRLIGATALAEGIALVTKDRAIRNYQGIKTIW